MSTDDEPRSGEAPDYFAEALALLTLGNLHRSVVSRAVREKKKDTQQAKGAVPGIPRLRDGNLDPTVSVTSYFSHIVKNLYQNLAVPSLTAVRSAPHHLSLNPKGSTTPTIEVTRSHIFGPVGCMLQLLYGGLGARDGGAQKLTFEHHFPVCKSVKKKKRQPCFSCGGQRKLVASNPIPRKCHSLDTEAV